MINQYLDILILNETRLDDTISDSEISIDKHDIVRRDRSRQGGGVASVHPNEPGSSPQPSVGRGRLARLV
jgi:hypothetical protein